MFRFKLQSVLDVRERLEKLKLKVFSNVLLEKQVLDDKINNHRENLSQEGKNADKIRFAGLSPYLLILHEKYRSRINYEIDLLREQLREKDLTLKAKREELVEARRAKRAIEILREKELFRYEKELKLREKNAYDEIATNNYIFKD